MKKVINKVLSTNVEIFGVYKCGLFEDSILKSNDLSIPKYCYKYDDHQSCFCLYDEDDAYCKNYYCHKYLNNAKYDIDADLHSQNRTSFE